MFNIQNLMMLLVIDYYYINFDFGLFLGSNKAEFTG